ncbi:diguanylate cyclase [Gammaproteobacteria bacterium LSUCC0112]|nr:diguanylate cyclase [Gammaproteobacteria bacterium LSUCC0112]
MVQRMQDEEAQRWKRKFLDALEEHENREKALSSRIKLLRRGLLGVSLAGDGHDPRLDKQLADLRASLRHDDREVGLERLLEQIEQSVIRLDNEKDTSNWALQQAFESAVSELSKLPLSGATRRQLKKFSSGLQTRLEDPQQHAGLIKQFVELLRESVQVLFAAQVQQDNAGSGSSKGFWQRLFSTSADQSLDSAQDSAGKQQPRLVDHAATSAATETARSFAVAQPQQPDDAHQPFHSSVDLHRPANAEQPIIEPVTKSSPSAANVINASLSRDAIKSPDIPGETAAPLLKDNEQDLNLQDDDSNEVLFQAEEPEGIEGELIRDRSGLAEPAFSYIAGHVEPLLLRILESIHITGESVSLVESIRRSIIKGLNWYDFVAILEQILQVLRNAADEQRAEFQGFLSEVTESLAQVQAFVDSSKRYTDKNSAADAEMDASVRAQIQGIRTAVERSDTDLETLKSSVQSQIGSIISSLDGFKSQRSQQDSTLSAEMRALTERIASLENESLELRLNLARQQESATKDTLTELPNREAYNQRVRQLLDNWLRGASHERRDEDRSLCLAVADVDFFKNINDSYGHLAGDKVLKIIARELVSRLRDRDFIGRYGGEEFVIIMPDTRPADAEHVLNKLRLAIAAIPFHFKERQIQITVSFGVVEAVRADSPDSLFERADKALYKAKENGRNRVHRDR